MKASRRFASIGVGRRCRSRRRVTRPPVGLRMPASVRSVVVFPAPFGPDQADDLAGADRERQVVDTAVEGRRIRPSQPFDSDRHIAVLRLGVPEVSDYVATHASALKAHRQSLKNREHNRQFRSRLRGALKSHSRRDRRQRSDRRRRTR